MRVFLYEWVSGGGMLAHEGPLLDELLTKGLTMAQAAAEDFSASLGAQVTLLRDLRVPQLTARGCEVREVDSHAAHNEAFETLCREADAVLLIAPETDGILLTAVAEAKRCGANLISPGAEFVAVASDKHQTAERLLASGVSAPVGRVLDESDSLPVDFTYPAVLKPIDGAGSHDTLLVAGPQETPPAYAGRRRLEPYIVGAPVSVGVLAGSAGFCPLPPCRQHISTDGRLRYLGGSTPLARGLAERAQELAIAAVATLPPAAGYIGVDLVLGADPDGSGDRVIEINPRLTTSYAGLRFAVEENLAKAMIAAAAGETVTLTPTDKPLEFGVDGVVSYTDD